MGYYFTEDYLAHHGIKGQRWGVRRFQNTDGTRTAAGKARAKENSSDDAQNDDSVSKKSGLTPEQKKALLIGLGVTAGIVAAYGGYRVYQNYKDKDTRYDRGLKLKDREFSADEDMAAVNGGRYLKPWLSFRGDYRKNCMLCSTTYELRRRGYDVKAGEEHKGKRWTDLTDVFDISEEDFLKRNREVKPGEDLAEVIRSFGKNTRGNLNIPGHSVVWECDEKGQPWIRDCQINKKFKILDKSTNDMSADEIKENGYINSILSDVYKAGTKQLVRTDDLPIRRLQFRDNSFINGDARWYRNEYDLPFGDVEVKALLRQGARASVAGAVVGNEYYKYTQNKENANDNTKSSKRDHKQKSS